MKEADLKAALAAAFADVRRLNDMQVEMWRCPADRIVLLAPTGSGKTLAYAGAMLRRLGPAGRGLQAVVLAPSRELVIQIYEVVRRLGREYKAAAFYGRHSMTDEIGSARHHRRHPRPPARPSAARHSHRARGRPARTGHRRVRQMPRPGICRGDAPHSAAARAPAGRDAHLGHAHRRDACVS